MDIAILREMLLYVILYFLLHLLMRRLLPSKRRPLPPGPRGFPVIGAIPLLGNAPHVALSRMAKQYGPVMYLKLGQKRVVVASTPAAARTFLKTLDLNFSNRPVGIAPTLLAYGAQDLVFVDYGPRWSLLRKTCSLGMLGPKALEGWTGVRRAELGLMLQSLLKLSRASNEVELREMLFCAMANMIGQVILKRRVFEARGSESSEFKKMVVELMTLAGLVNVGDYLPAVAWMDLQGLGRRMRGLHKRFDELLSRMFAEHKASVGERREEGTDLLDMIMGGQEGDGGEKLSDDNIKALLLNLFSAGTDTSSSTIEWAIAELLLNPTILKRAQSEMDQVIGRSRRLEESDIPNLPYLKAICKEAFRKHPSTPLNLPRICTKACEANGYSIPKDTILLVNIWAIGRDPDVWKDPHEFNPDRFMTAEGTKIDPKGNHFELIPFGAGRRMCAGARMGVVLVQYILGTLIHSFDWEMPKGVEPNMDEDFGIALQKSVPVSAMVSPRLEPNAYV
ncbi:flavonoid 3',5'-hydroxylase 1-like [Typha latifolia]|uniref:flavonoid 3',5'-hydroxylase 1-like n=1 Tax=Typha latifolia TaxID=4733 RepID=UPI003C2D2199